MSAASRTAPFSALFLSALTLPHGRRPEPRPGRARVRFSFLPALALLVAALSPLTAQAQTTIWSATLTVDVDMDNNTHGCDDHPNSLVHDCSSALTDNSFDYKGVTYTVKTFYYEPAFSELTIDFDKAAPSPSGGGKLDLSFGGQRLALANAPKSTSGEGVANGRITEFISNPNWSDGDTVPLSLTETPPPPPPTQPTNLAVTNANQQLFLHWTASSGEVTGYQVHYTSASIPDVGADDAASGSNAAAAWVATGRSGTDKTPSQTITGLANGTTYRVRVRVVGLGHTGDWIHGYGTPTAIKKPWLSGLTGSASTDGTTFGDALTLTPAFYTARLHYTAAVAAGVTHVRLTPGGVNYGSNDADIYKRRSDEAITHLSSAEPSADMALNAGATEIVVFVRNKDQNTGFQTLYTVTVHRTGSRPTTPTTPTGPTNPTGPTTPTGPTNPPLATPLDAPRSFKAEPFAGYVYLSWEDPGSQSANISGYSFRYEGTAHSANWTTIPESGEGQENRTAYRVGDLPDGEYAFDLRAVDAQGVPGNHATATVSLPTTVSAETGELPDGVTLAPTYPNPFNPATTITYALDRARRVELTVYDMTGRIVETLADGMRPAGRHEVRFDAAGLPTGAYVVRLRAGSETLTRTMTLVR